MNIIKKISITDVVGRIEQPSESVELFYVIGVINGIKYKNTVVGNVKGFSGNFEAVNLRTLEAYSSNVCFLPDVAADLLTDADEFAFIIGVKPSGKKFDYFVKVVSKPQKVDSLASMRLTVLKIDEEVKKIELKLPVKKK